MNKHTGFVHTDVIKAIYEDLKEGLVIIDKNGTVHFANKSVMKMLNENNLLHKNILHVCNDDNLRKGIKECFTGVNTEITFKRGGKMYCVRFSSVDDESEIEKAIILFGDATKKYITERSIAEKRRREFMSNVSHELKTPLTTISALSEMIINGMAKEEDVKGFAMKIYDQAKLLTHITDTSIKLSDVDGIKIDKEYSTFNLYELTELVVSALRDEADKKRVTVRIDGAGFHVTSNKHMINELMYNLIDNGIKYNNEDGQIIITLSSIENGVYKITVTDTGIGIPEEHLDRVFELFHRVDKSRSKKTGGVGLGLSIVKHIVEHHNGEVEIKSVEGVGTTVICCMINVCPFLYK